MSNPTTFTDRPATNRGRGGRTLFALLAIASLAIAALIYWLGEPLGLEPEVADLIALAFLFVAAFDLVVLASWRRIFQTMN